MQSDAKGRYGFDTNNNKSLAFPSSIPQEDSVESHKKKKKHREKDEEESGGKKRGKSSKKTSKKSSKEDKPVIVECSTRPCLFLAIFLNEPTGPLLRISAGPTKK